MTQTLTDAELEALRDEHALFILEDIMSSAELLGAVTCYETRARAQASPEEYEQTVDSLIVRLVRENAAELRKVVDERARERSRQALAPS